MALTEYEKKILEQMEASLREEDPALASQMSAPVSDEPESEAPAAPRGPRRIALGLTGAVLGMVVLVAAVSLGYSVISLIVGVAGFLFMLGGAWYALQTPRVSRPGAKRSSFMQRQEERWDRRSADE